MSHHLKENRVGRLRLFIKIIEIIIIILHLLLESTHIFTESYFEAINLRFSKRHSSRPLSSLDAFCPTRFKKVRVGAENVVYLGTSEPRDLNATIFGYQRSLDVCRIFDK